MDANELLPVVYNELRNLARVWLAREKPGQTLQATALVHEAFLRLAGDEQQSQWNGRSHFFAAAAETIRRILVDNARKKRAEIHGGNLVRHDINHCEPQPPAIREDLIALDDALTALELIDADAAKVVRMRYFAGLTLEEAAEALEISPRTAGRLWAFARAWLRRELGDPDQEP